MNPQIDPLILQKLEAFSRRRRKLIIFRGVCAAVATLLAAMMLIAFVDWTFVLPDAVRWALSGAAYAAIIVVEWRSCVRLLLRAPGPRRLARLVEHAEPKLREDLLSAVELGDAKSDAAFDSEQFRALVQSDVAGRMETLDVERLLPARLVRRYVGIAIAVGVACVVAFALTGFQFGTLMMRALLPMANLARVSKVQVRIVEPNPAEMRVPQGDTVPLVIELGGRRANKAVLETFTKNGGREIVQMNPSGKDRFSATIQVGREDVQYRVRAGDALTRKYQLGAVARPAVVRFEKTYVFPEYAKLAAKHVTEENGDLAALEGTEVELRLETNQKIKDGELRIEQGKKSYAAPLKLEGGKLVGRVALNASGIYRVRLTGAESGFENKFSPEYELRAEPDLMPQVELKLPKQDLILPANEIVDVVGAASDDFALARVSQMVKINDGEWTEVPLSKEPGAKAKVERRWDLFEQGVKPGDLVTTKLAAVDLKGNRGESRPLQVTITASGFESKRIAALEAQRQLLETLKAQQASAQALAKQAAEARDQFARLPAGDGARKQALVSASAAMAEFERRNADAVNQLGAVLREAEAGHRTGDLVMLARSLARANAGAAQQAGRIFEMLNEVEKSNAAGEKSEPPRVGSYDQSSREAMREAADAAARADRGARLAFESYRTFLTAEEIDVLNENLHALASEQRRLGELAANSGEDAAKWTQLANRMRVVLSETRSLEELAAQSAEHAPGGMPNRLRALQNKLNKQRIAVENTIAKKAVGKELLAPTVLLTSTIVDGERIALELKREITAQPQQAFAALLREAEPAYANFAKLREETLSLSRKEKLPMEMRAALAGGRWEAKFQLLKAHGDAEEMRADSDTYFVNDLRAATRALQALRDKREEAPPEEIAQGLAAMDRYFRMLESGHDLAEIADGLERLAAAERWEIYTPKSRTTNPRDWFWLAARLRIAPEEIGRALAAEPARVVAQAVQKILREAHGDASAAQLEREMRERLNANREPASAREDAEKVAAIVRRAVELFRKPMEDARKELAQMAPKLSETMAHLAKETEKLKTETAQQARKPDEIKAGEAKTEAQKTLAAQQKLNEKIDVLKDALRADANQRDILQAEARERARDADDALAMLKEPPPRAAEDLARATQSDKAPARAEALTQAAAQQQKLEDSLKLLAEHYGKMETGEAAETRMALRASEEANGVKEQLDAQFAKASELARLAQVSPEELLAQLEKALPKNATMQKELSAISRDTLTAAGKKLQQASGQENAVAQQLEKMAAEQASAAPPAGKNPQLSETPENAQQPIAGAQQSASARSAESPAGLPQSAQPKPAGQQPMTAAGAQPQTASNPNPPPPNASATANAPSAPSAPNVPNAPAPNPQLAQAAAQQTPIARAADESGAEIGRAGRHEERLQNKLPGEQLQQLGARVQTTAQTQVPNAQQALANAQQAAQAQAAVTAANVELQSEAGQLAKALNPGAKAPGAQPPPQQQAAGAKQTDQSLAAGKERGQTAAGEQSGAGEQPGQMARGEQATAKQSASRKAGISAQQNGPHPELPGEEAPWQMAGAMASPQEQVWMARTLDAIDAALNAPESAADSQGQAGKDSPQGEPGKNPPSQGKAKGSQPADAASQAKAGMSATAQAAAASMRASRSPTPADAPGGPLAKDGQQAVSKNGAQVQGASAAHGALADAKNKNGEWGKLPKQMAEQLTQGQREGTAGEYRNQVETYYRVIAERAKKP